MLSPSLAFTWVLWRQHRWGLLLVFGGLLLAGTVSAFVPLYGHPSVMAGVFSTVVLPLVMLSLYPLVVFTYGFDAGDVMARESCFPTGLLRLPLRTLTLVLWPMIFGAVATFLVWLVALCFIFRPWQEIWQTQVMPVWWPSMMAVAFLAWLQALLWAPFGLPWLRVFLVLIMVQGMIAMPIYALHLGVSEGTLVALFASVTVLAWGIGYVGVQHARRGDGPNWEWIFSAASQFVRGLPRSRQPFASSARAQVWFEWRLAGKMLPILTGLIMLPLFLLSIYAGNVDADFAPQSFLCTLAVPVFFASVAGWLGTRRSRWVEGRTGMMLFTATLPMTTAEMVGAIFKTAAWSTLATWVVIAVMWPLATMVTWNIGKLPAWWQEVLNAQILSQVVTGVLAITIVHFVWTWKRNLDGLYVGLIGNKWIEGTVAWSSLPVTYLLCVFVGTIYVSPRAHYEITLAVWPWLLGTVVFLRLLTATWALQETLRQGLVQPITAACWVVAWVFLASILFALAVWAMPSELVPMYHLAFGVAIVLPTVRLAAAPLAVAWARHR